MFGKAAFGWRFYFQGRLLDYRPRKKSTCVFCFTSVLFNPWDVLFDQIVIFEFATEDTFVLNYCVLDQLK